VNKFGSVKALPVVSRETLRATW